MRNDVRPGELVRWVEPDEVDHALVDEARDGTYVEWVEYALIETDSGPRALIRGGLGGISFGCREEGERRVVFLTIAGQEVGVARLVWHTNPIATGPSDHDLKMLEILGQDESLIHEIGGQPGGTRIRPKRPG